MDCSSTFDSFNENIHKSFIIRPFGYIDLYIINGIPNIIYREPCTKCGFLYRKSVPAKSFIAENLKVLGDLQKEIDIEATKRKYANLYYDIN